MLKHDIAAGRTAHAAGRAAHAASPERGARKRPRTRSAMPWRVPERQCLAQRWRAEGHRIVPNLGPAPGANRVRSHRGARDTASRCKLSLNNKRSAEHLRLMESACFRASLSASLLDEPRVAPLVLVAHVKPHILAARTSTQPRTLRSSTD
eukprot:4565222-Pleurochrysis_carterae.AAC.1